MSSVSSNDTISSHRSETFLRVSDDPGIVSMESGISSSRSPTPPLQNGDDDDDEGREDINLGHVDEKAVLKTPTAMELMHARKKERTTSLNVCRDAVNRIADNNHLRRAQVETLLSDKEFCKHLFGLFNHESKDSIPQDVWIESIKQNIGIGTSNTDLSSDKRTDVIELLEAIAYIICGDDAIDCEALRKILSSRGIPAKILILADANKDGVVSVEEMMEFIIILTNRRRLTELTAENIKHLEKMFRDHLTANKNEFNLTEFKQIVPSKNPFFVERAFRIFDEDGNGSVSMTEFINTMTNQFAEENSDEKIIFLFKVYDLDDDGLIQQSDLREVMKACMEENGMKFDEKEVEDLAQALYEDAAGLADGPSIQNGITIEDLKAELTKHDGLVENLSLSIGKWLVPQKPPRPKSFKQKLVDCFPRQFSLSYLKNNKIFLSFLFFIISINIILFVTRAYYFRNFSMLNGSKPNPFYLLSRANGRVLHFNSMMLLIFVLRYTITKMRELGLTKIFPLDNNIYFHKCVGILVFIQAWIHSIMHLCNFGFNLQPDPIKFVQMTSSYWDSVGPKRPGWTNLRYNVPAGCEVTNSTERCGDKIDPSLNVTWCQLCPDGEPWSFVQWIFTGKPGVFGLVGGFACPTGIILIIVLTIMAICSMPFVRRGGYFEVFYFTHLLNIVYWVLLILHAPDFWKWIIVPGIVYILEVSYRNLTSWMGKGKTTIFAGVVLPSKVTNLIIKRPDNLNFSPGDWVFVKIPAIAKSEWHPFTISSAPEQEGYFTLHIRGVGEWTNRLYIYFEEEYQKQQEGREEVESGFDRIRGTMRRKYTSIKKAIGINKLSEAADREGSPQDFQSIAGHYRYDAERSKQRMKIREEKLRKRDSDDGEHTNGKLIGSESQSFRYMRRQPTIVQYDSEILNLYNVDNNNKSSFDDDDDDSGGDRSDNRVLRRKNSSRLENGQKEPGKKMTLRKPLEIFIDGPFGAPSSNIFRAEHAVLISTGIGVTPFASILQSIMHRYWQVKRQCPSCAYKWSDDISSSMFNLKKVDFYWINRDQMSFEWFVNLLSQLEIEQSEQGGVMGHFLDMHMYITSALQRTDMKAVGLQLALDLLHEKEKRDLVTGLKSRTNAGRPNWNKIFTQIREQRKGRVTVFYCGNPILSKILRQKCWEFGFQYRKEVF